jgi:hypothetical protein
LLASGVDMISPSEPFGIYPSQDVKIPMLTHATYAIGIPEHHLYDYLVTV